MPTVAPRPFEGSQPKNTANNMINISPTQNVGRENPKIDSVMMVLPVHDLGRKPA